MVASSARHCSAKLGGQSTARRAAKLGNNLNQRDTIAVKRTVSGLLKLIHPDEEYGKEDVEECLVYALEVRRRVKEHSGVELRWEIRRIGVKA